MQYRAPELILKMKQFSIGVDIWSIGCIFAELLTGNVLFHGISDFQNLLRMVYYLGKPSIENWKALINCGEIYNVLPDLEYTGFGEIGENNDFIDDADIEFLSKMLRFNPANRLTCKELLLDPYLN